MQVGRYWVGATRTGFSGDLASHAPVTTQCTVFAVHPLPECVIAPKAKALRCSPLFSSFRTPPLLTPSSAPPFDPLLLRSAFPVTQALQRGRARPKRCSFAPKRLFLLTSCSNAIGIYPHSRFLSSPYKLSVPLYLSPSHW